MKLIRHISLFIVSLLVAGQSWAMVDMRSATDGIHPLASQSFAYDSVDRLIYASGVY